MYMIYKCMCTIYIACKALPISDQGYVYHIHNTQSAIN